MPKSLLRSRFQLSRKGFGTTRSQNGSGSHRCPRCLKNFKTHARLLQHMNHPLTSCLRFANQLVSVSSVIQRRNDRLAKGATNGVDDQIQDEDEEIFLDEYGGGADYSYEEEMAWDPGPDGMEDRDSFQDNSSSDPASLVYDPETKTYREYFPGAAEVVEQGQTFMEQFDADGHADKRADNIFYPFASRDEMEFASFLLRSGLSVSKIDELLSLEIVSDYYGENFDQSPHS